MEHFGDLNNLERKTVESTNELKGSFDMFVVLSQLDLDFFPLVLLLTKEIRSPEGKQNKKTEKDHFFKMMLSKNKSLLIQSFLLPGSLTLVVDSFQF